MTTLINRITFPRLIRDEFFNDVESTFNRFFNDLTIKHYPSPLIPADVGYPKIDIYDTTGSYIVEASVPGLNKKDLNVRIEDNLLIIRGETRLDRKGKDIKCIYREMKSSKFTRTLALNDEVNTENIKIKLNNGVLLIMLPKKEVDPDSFQELEIQ